MAVMRNLLLLIYCFILNSDNYIFMKEIWEEKFYLVKYRLNGIK